MDNITIFANIEKCDINQVKQMLYDFYKIDKLIKIRNDVYFVNEYIEGIDKNKQIKVRPVLRKPVRLLTSIRDYEGVVDVYISSSIDKRILKKLKCEVVIYTPQIKLSEKIVLQIDSELQKLDCNLLYLESKDGSYYTYDEGLQSKDNKFKEITFTHEQLFGSVPVAMTIC